MPLDRICADAIGAESERRVADRPAEHVVQIDPVRRHIRRAVFFPRDRFERLAETQLALIPGHRHDAERLKRVAHQFVFEAERAQHLDAVRTDLQSGADLFQLGGSFEYRDLKAPLAQCDGGREAADTGADNNHAQFSYWLVPSAQF